MRWLKISIILLLLIHVLSFESTENRVEETPISDFEILKIQNEIEELFPLEGFDINIQEFIEKMLKYITSIPGIKYIPDVVFKKIIDPIIAKIDKMTEQIKDRLKPEEKEFKIEYIYPYVEHKIVTEDGYILTAWNFNLDIVKPKQGINSDSNKEFLKDLPGKGKVIMVQHGLLDDSYTWITLKEKAITTLLIRAGYDVWLTNNRGNIYSWEHTNPKMNSRNLFNAYWDFSFDEIAKYDLPANIDYILKHTGKESLYYMGHSQGTIQFYISYTLRPEYMKTKVKKFASIGTVFSLFNSKSWIIKLIEDTHILAIFNTFKLKNLLTLNYKYLGLVYSFCKLFQDKICGAIIDPLINTNFHNTHRIDWGKIPNLFRNEPGGSSVQNLQHWIQLDQNKEMIMFDFGSKKKNKQHYGQPTPPKYNYKEFETFDIPSYITKTEADPFSLNLDTKILEDYLSEEAKKKITFKVLDNYNHLDYVWSDTSYDEFYGEVMDFFNKSGN